MIDKIKASSLYVPVELEDVENGEMLIDVGEVIDKARIGLETPRAHIAQLNETIRILTRQLAELKQRLVD